MRNNASGRGGYPRLLAIAEFPGDGRALRLGEVLSRAGFSFALRSLPRESPEGGDLGDTIRALLREEKPELVFCPSADRGLLDLLEKERAPLVGSPSSVLELCRSKSRLKRAWEDREIPSPSFFRVRRTRTGAVSGRRQIGAAADFPYIVKPDRGDEKRGARARSIAFDPGSLAACIDSGLEECDELLVEHFVFGASSREYSVAMIGSGDRALMLPAEMRLGEERPIKVVTREDRERGLALAVPVEGAERERVGAFASRVFAAVGVRDYARCDLIGDAGRLYALDVNARPPLPDPWFESCAAGTGLDEDRYVAAVALAAFARRSGAASRSEEKTRA
jgi:D-alanine-D-alanine ligase-like ATP-grasp enzyme